MHEKLCCAGPLNRTGLNVGVSQESSFPGVSVSEWAWFASTCVHFFFSLLFILEAVFVLFLPPCFSSEHFHSGGNEIFFV